MESNNLVYIWIENYNCLNNIEINFSSKYNIYFNKKNNLLIEENVNYIDNFYSENIDLTVLIGRNGVGKTTIFKLISRLCYGDNLLLDDNTSYITVFSSKQGENEELICIYYMKNGSDVFINSKKMNVHKEKLLKENVRIGDNKYRDKLKRNIYYIYYSESLYNRIYDFQGINNINTANIIYNIQEQSKKQDQVLDSFYLDEFSKQIQYVFDNREKLSSYNINFPEDIEMHIQKSIETYNWINNNAEHYKTIENYLNNYIDENFNIKFAEEILLYLCSIDKNNFEKVNSKINSDNLYKNVFDFVIDCLKYIQGKNDFYDPTINVIKYYTNNLSKNVSYIMNIFIDNLSINVKDKEKQKKVKEFINLISKSFIMGKIVKFKWNLSSGEISLLSLFSRLYNLIDKNDNKIKDGGYANLSDNIILMLDEAETYLHPEWQRLYINSIIKAVNDIFKNKYIHIFIATHSPMILSDIPKQNIVFIEKNADGKTVIENRDNHMETFSANLYDLYKDSFFLENGTIGEFAKEKLIEIVKMIESNKNKKDVEKMINMISDEYIKDKFKSMLNYRTYKHYDKD